jgi:hypothetical protein
MNLIRVNLEQISNINCDFSITEDNAILYVKVSGNYREASAGNLDGLYLFSLLAAHYFAFEPITLILDIQQLKYSWGNTINKSLNFFSEIGRDADEKNKLIIIICSEINQPSVLSITNTLIDGNRLLCENYNEASNAAIKYVENYLETN